MADTETVSATQKGASKVPETNKPNKELTPVNRIKNLLNSDEVTKKFKDLLGKRAQGFIVSVMQVVTSNDLLKKADPHSVYAAAATAAILDLPLNNNFGFAYIVPYEQDSYDDKGNL